MPHNYDFQITNIFLLVESGGAAMRYLVRLVAGAFVSLFSISVASSQALSGGGELFIPAPKNSAMTLGSGVDVRDPTKAIMSCFNVKTASLDNDGAVLSYDYTVNVAYSDEHLQRMKSQSVSGSFKYKVASASASVSSSASNVRDESKLYVILTGKITTGRIGAAEVSLKPGLKDLAEKRDFAKLVGTCGTHVVTTEHRGQSIRLIIDFSGARLEAKRELSAQFSGKLKTPVLKANISANYRQEFQKLSNEKNLGLVVEGTGWLPDTSTIFGLLTANNGDLTAVANALGKLMGDNVTKASSGVTYGFNLQPIYLADASLGDMPRYAKGDIGADLFEYQDLLGIIEADLDLTRKRENVAGIDEADRSKLKAQRIDLQALRKDAEKGLQSCFSESAAESCSDSTNDLRARLIRARNPSAKVSDVTTAGAVHVDIDTTLTYSAIGTFLLEIGGTEYALDTVKIRRGVNSISMLKTVKEAEETILVSDAPLAAMAMAIPAAMAEDAPTTASPKLQKLEVGCHSSIVTMDSSSATISAPIKATIASAECYEPPVVAGYANFTPPAITMLPGLFPNEPRVELIFGGERRLLLDLVDETGLSMRVLVAGDLTTTLATALKSQAADK